MKKPYLFLPRLCMTLVGVFLCAIAVGFFQCSLFGVDPFQCFAQGSWGRIGLLDYGTFYIILNALLLIVDFILDKHYIGIATFINLFLTGYIVDFSHNTINALLPDPSLPVRVVLLLIGVVVMCFASALYMTSDLGVSTYDTIAIVLSNKVGVEKFKFCRIGTDLVCVTIGALCGLLPGLGTLITAFFMGPLISFFNRTVAVPLLYGKHGERRPAEQSAK